MEAKAIQLPTQRLQHASISQLHHTGHAAPKLSSPHKSKPNAADFFNRTAN
jgi:hypothetical protein